MTAPYRMSAACPGCGTKIPLEDSIGQWIRNHPRLGSSEGFVFFDRDLVCHRYKTDNDRTVQYLMCVEWKTNGAELSPTQRDSLVLFAQLLDNRRQTPTQDRRSTQGGLAVRKTWSTINRRWIRLRAFGVHLVTCSGREPTNGELWWDRRPITVDQLVDLLRFDIDPDTLLPMDNRRHHAIAPHQLPLVAERR